MLYGFFSTCHLSGMRKSARQSANLRQSRIVCRANDAVLQVQDDDDELTMVNGSNDTATDHRIHAAVGNHLVADAGFRVDVGT